MLSRLKHAKLEAYVLFAIVIASISAVHAQNRKVNLQENLPFEEVLKQAQAEDKYIFLDFGSLTCKPCLYIKQHVLTLDSVADFINPRFVSVDYNLGAEKDRLRKLYNVIGEPVLLILDKHGNLMHRMVGRMEGDELMARFRQGLDTDNNLVALMAKYDRGARDVDFIMQYLETLRISRDVDIMNAVLKDYLSGPLENLKKPEIYDVFLKYNEDLLSREMLYVFDNRTEFYELFGARALDAKIRNLFMNKSRFYLYGHNPPADDPNFHRLLEYVQKTDFPDASEWLVYLRPAKYKYKDWVAMAEEVDKAFDFNIIKGWSGDSFKEMMVTQFMMYCDDADALQYAVRWCEDLKEDANADRIANLEKSQARVLDKIARVEKDKSGDIEWTDIDND